MIVQEIISENLVRTYSDSGFLIHGGSPEGDYTEAIDPISLGRIYTETNIPIKTEEDNEETIDNEYAEAGRILMGVEE